MKSNAQYQQELRERRREAGHTEVRGLYAPTKKHAEIKQEVRGKYPIKG